MVLLIQHHYQEDGLLEVVAVFLTALVEVLCLELEVEDLGDLLLVMVVMQQLILEVVVEVEVEVVVPVELVDRV
jgi:predicted ATPase